MSALTHGSETSQPASRLGFVVIALIALFTLVDLFAAQAILPLLAVRYGARPAQIGVAVNASTAGMAIGALVTALFGARIDRRLGIVVSLVTLTLPSALLAFAPNLMTFTALRVMQGLCMSCAFTLTLAHLGETCAPERQAGAFAAYITGNVGSNLIGRLVAGLTAGLYGTSVAFLVFAALNLVGAALAAATIGPRAAPAAAGSAAPRIRDALKPTLLAGYAVGFLILFVFIGVFSYANFVLMGPRLGVGMMALGLIYLVFAPSIVATPMAGVTAKRYGALVGLAGGLAVAAVGLLMMASLSVPIVIGGMMLVGLGTFFAQATATGQVSRAAGGARAAASGLYLTAYFAGGLVGAATFGMLFERSGWGACLWLAAAALAGCAALGLSFRPRRRAA